MGIFYTKNMLITIKNLNLGLKIKKGAPRAKARVRLFTLPLTLHTAGAVLLRRGYNP